MPVFERQFTVGKNLFELRDVPVTTAHLRNYYPGERTGNPLDTFLWGVNLDEYSQAGHDIVKLPLLLAKDLYHHQQNPQSPTYIPDRLVAVVASTKNIGDGKFEEINNAFSHYGFNRSSLPNKSFFPSTNRWIWACLRVESFVKQTTRELLKSGWLKAKSG